MGNDSAIVTVADDRIVYRASALGSCTRALVAARQGYEPVAPFDSALELFQAGHDIEEKYVATTVWPITDTQNTVTVPVTEKLQVVGHIDGVRGGNVVEIKSQSAEVFDKWTHDLWATDPLWQKYAWQASVYMAALHLGLELIRINRDTHQALSTFYEIPFRSKQEIVERVLLVEMLAADEKLPETCDKTDWICPYRYTHPTLEPTNDPELEIMVADYHHAKADLTQYESRVKDLKGLIEKHLGDRQKVLLLSGATVSRSEYTVKEHVVKESTQVRLTVKKST